MTEAIDNGDDRFTQLIRMLDHFTVDSSDGFRIFAKFLKSVKKTLAAAFDMQAEGEKGPGCIFPHFRLIYIRNCLRFKKFFLTCRFSLILQ